MATLDVTGIEYTIGWRTTVREYHTRTVPFSDLPEDVQRAIITGTMTAANDDSLIDYLVEDESYDDLTEELVSERVIRSIKKASSDIDR